MVITGIGAITPIGTGADGLWAGVLADRSAVRPIDRFDASPFPSRIAAQVDDFEPADHLDAKRARRLDRFSPLRSPPRGWRSTTPGWPARPTRPAPGVWIGSALGGVAFGEEQHAGYVPRGVRGVAPTLALAVFGGAGASNVAIDLGLPGPTVGNANSCASGAIAIGQAFQRHPRRDRDAALAGGAEAPLAPLTFGAFAMIRVLSQRNDDPATASRPFDRDRDGFVMAEGAAMLVLEERDAAVRRGARILAEVAGFGATNDAYHMTAPRPDGRDAARAIRPRWPTPASRPSASATSTPTPPHAAQRARRGERDPAAFGRGTPRSRCPARRACTATRWARPARSRPRSRLALDRGCLPGTCNLA